MRDAEPEPAADVDVVAGAQPQIRVLIVELGDHGDVSFDQDLPVPLGLTDSGGPSSVRPARVPDATPPGPTPAGQAAARHEAATSGHTARRDGSDARRYALMGAAMRSFKLAGRDLT